MCTVMALTSTLEKPDPSIVRGSGHNPILQFVHVPTAEILQSNQIAEHTYYDILTSGENSRLSYS